MANIDIVKFTDNSKRTLEELAAVSERILEAWGIIGERNAKLELENNPRRIDTGLLRNSITYAVSGEPPGISTYQSSSTDKNGNPVDPIETGSYSGTAPFESGKKKAVYIGTNVSYSAYVHEGTSGGTTKNGGKIPAMAPNRFLKNAVVNHKSDYEKIAKQELSG